MYLYFDFTRVRDDFSYYLHGKREKEAFGALGIIYAMMANGLLEFVV